MSVSPYPCPGSEEGLKTIFIFKERKEKKMAVNPYFIQNHGLFHCEG